MQKQLLFILACLLLCVFLFACGETPAESGTTAATTEISTEPMTEVTTAATTESGDFTVVDGVLLAFSGNDTEITLPDSVVRISADAFAASPDLTAITLGKNVKTIDETAFMPLHALRRISVPAENSAFTVCGNFLVNADKTQMLLFGTTVEEGWEKLDGCLAQLRPATDTLRAVLGYAVLELQLTRDDSNALYVFVGGVSAYGHTIVFDKPYQTVFATGGVRLFSVGEQIVLTYAEPAHTLDNYVLDRSGIYKLCYSTEPSNADYNEPVIWLLKGDGNLRFECYPKKFAYHYPRYEYLTGSEEILKICGTVTCEDGKFYFSEDEILRFSDLNANGMIDYSYFCDTGGGAEELAHLMEENAKKYEPFTFEIWLDAYGERPYRFLKDGNGAYTDMVLDGHGGAPLWTAPDEPALSAYATLFNNKTAVVEYYTDREGWRFDWIDCESGELLYRYDEQGYCGYRLWSLRDDLEDCELSCGIGKGFIKLNRRIGADGTTMVEETFEPHPDFKDRQNTPEWQMQTRRIPVAVVPLTKDDALPAEAAYHTLAIHYPVSWEDPARDGELDAYYTREQVGSEVAALYAQYTDDAELRLCPRIIGAGTLYYSEKALWQVGLDTLKTAFGEDERILNTIWGEPWEDRENDVWYGRTADGYIALVRVDAHHLAKFEFQTYWVDDVGYFLGLVFMPIFLSLLYY